MKGIAPPLATDALINAVLFGVNGMAQRALKPHPDALLGPSQIFACGSFAGL